MNVRLATQADEARWNDFIFSQTEGSFLQSWEWGKAQDLLGHVYWRVIAEEDHSPTRSISPEFSGWQAAALVVKRELPFGRCWLYVPRGPVLAKTHEAWEALQQKLVELGTQEKAIFVRVDPAWQEAGVLSGWEKAEREVQPQHTLLLDLNPGEDMLLENMHAKTRYNVRLAQRKGVTVRFSTSLDAIDVFLDLSKHVRNRSGFSYHPDNYYRALLSALAPHSMVEVAIAEYKEGPLAAHIVVYAGGVATYAHGASSGAHRAVMAPQLTYWETIRRAKEKGMHVYDFFGVAPKGSDKKHPWAGITRVKEGFGGKRVSYVGAHDLVLDENFYTIVNTLRRVKKLWR